MTNHAHAYARSAVIRRVVTAARKTGLEVSRVCIHPDGLIELKIDFDNLPTPANDFDRLEASRCL